MDLAVTLGTDIVYIFGTVNGVAAEWVYVGAAQWATTVDRAPEGEYVIEVIGYDEAGNSETLTRTINYGLALVFNRTQADVDRAVYLTRKGWAALADEERAEWRAGLRGAYNESDLNRVEQAVEFLQDLLRGYGCDLNLTTKTDWTRADLTHTADMARYLGNVRAFQTDFAPFMTEGLPESMADLTIAGANAIERFLYNVYYYIQLMASGYFMAGEVMSGEV